MPHPVAGAVISLGFATFFAAIGVWSAKKGRMPTRGGIITKEEYPLAFKVGLWVCRLASIIFFLSGALQLYQAFSR